SSRRLRSNGGSAFSPSVFGCGGGLRGRRPSKWRGVAKGVGRDVVPPSVRGAATPIDALLEAAEEIAHLRVSHRLAAVVRKQILLRDIGDVLGLLVLREQMIEGLVLCRADLFRDCAVPFLGVGEIRI